MAERKLGERQASCLEGLVEHNGWHAYCGWCWTGPATTKRILDSLVRRSLASVTMTKTRFGFDRAVYYATEAGRARVRDMKKETKR